MAFETTSRVPGLGEVLNGTALAPYSLDGFRVYMYPLSSREIDVGIADGLSNYGRCNGRLGLLGAHRQIWPSHFYRGFVALVDHSWHRLAQYYSALLVVSNDRITDYDPQAPGMQGQLLTNNFKGDL